jgi:hypothetical protein
MRVRLNDLPVPPPGHTGWPWTEESTRLPDRDPDGKEWPRVTIVTPSFNQEQFVEATLRSVLLQGYPNLEYFVLDGGSTDGSVEIIKKYSPWLTHWVSEPDGGQSSAINRGWRLGTGAFTTWINSDDMLCRDALTTHATTVGFDTGVVYVGDCLYIDDRDALLQVHRGRVHTFEDLVRIPRIWRDQQPGYIDQPAALFSRQLALDVGALDPQNHRTMDYELWGKFFLAGAAVRYTEIPFGIFRIYSLQKTADGLATTRSLLDTARRLIAQAPTLSDDLRDEILAELATYERKVWRHTGRLARIGLPERVVTPIRRARTQVEQALSKMRDPGLP